MDQRTNAATIVVGVESHEIETRPLTLVCHDGTADVEAPGLVEIDPVGTVNRVEMMGQSDWDALRPRVEPFFRLVFDDMALPESVHALQNGHVGRRHVVGLIVMLGECLARGQRPFIRAPEAYLHPKQQLGLGDLFLQLSRPLGRGSGGEPEGHR